MRIYTDVMEAIRETERDLFEMGIDVKPKSMQNKSIEGNEDYATKELQAYGFQIVEPSLASSQEEALIEYITKDPVKARQAALYIEAEHNDRTSGSARNPGNAFTYRLDTWQEFRDPNGFFHYTYSERMAPQLAEIEQLLRKDNDSRQGIINIHSNIAVNGCCGNSSEARGSQDLRSLGGKGRVPCSMYYQVMIRNGKMDLIYTMRSCDYLTHFYVDLCLAIRLQQWFALRLNVLMGKFTYFTGSLHAYNKDMKSRGVF